MATFVFAGTSYLVWNYRLFADVEYNGLIEKYTSNRNEFETNMTESCKVRVQLLLFCISHNSILRYVITIDCN